MKLFCWYTNIPSTGSVWRVLSLDLLLQLILLLMTASAAPEVAVDVTPCWMSEAHIGSIISLEVLVDLWRVMSKLLILVKQIFVELPDDVTLRLEEELDVDSLLLSQIGLKPDSEKHELMES